MKVLYVEDNKADADLTRRALAGSDIILEIEPTLAAALARINADPSQWDLVLSDVHLPDGTGVELLVQIRERELPLAMVIVTGFGEEELAVGAIKAGADDFVMKREGYLERLPAVLEDALRRFRDETRRHATPLHVLYAQMDEADAHQTTAHFTQHAPYLRVDVVALAQDVLNLCAGGGVKKYDVILLDYRLPDANAIGVLKTLRQDFKMDLPIVLVAEQGEEELAAESLRLGASDFLIKRSGYFFQLPHVIENAFHRAQELRDYIAVRESEERYRMLFDGAIDGMVLVDANLGSVIACNEALLNMVGRSREEVVGAPETILHPSNKDGMLALASALERFRITGHDVGLTDVLTKSGQRLPVEIKSSELMLRGRRVLLGVFRDVTERLRAEEALRLRNSALEAAANAIFITDRKGEIVWTNPAFTQSTGYTAEEALGKNPRILKSGVQSSEYYREMWKTILSGKVWEGEFVNLRKDGSLFIEQSTITPVRNEVGKITNFIAVKQDVTDRKQTEQKLHDQAHLLDLANDAIIVCEPGHSITRWNRGAERLYGWTEAETIGKNLHLLLGESGSSSADITRVLWEEDSWNGELRQKARSGKDVVVASRWTLIRDDQGQPKSILILNADITEKKGLESQFLRMQRVESIGTLAAGIAHDLNNILAPILMVGPLLEEKVKDEEGRWLLESARKNAERGAAIVKQLLTFAKGGEGERVPLQLTRLVRDMAGIVRETFPKNIQCECGLASDAWSVRGNLTQLHQVLLNLCVNARDAMPEGGRLTLAMENIVIDEAFAAMELQARPGPHLVLTVADTGVGIPPEIIERIFDPFFTTKEPDKGTGLGLATVLGIIRGHGGFIRLSSRVGEGTQFKVYLPASDTGVVKDRGEQAAVIPRGNGELILLVDDEEPVRATSRRVLTKFGYKVIEAADGTEAISQYARSQNEIKLVFTDLQMPFMDGPTLIRTLRKMNPALKILTATGYGSKGALKEINDLGICGLLNKPFAPKDLLAAVEASLKGAPLPVVGQAS